MLTSVGLLIFTSASDLKPSFYPILNASLNFDYKLKFYLPSLPSEIKSYFIHDDGLPLLRIKLMDLKPLLLLLPSFAEQQAWISSIARLQNKFISQ